MRLYTRQELIDAIATNQDGLIIRHISIFLFLCTIIVFHYTNYIIILPIPENIIT